MNALLNATDRVNEATAFSELLMLAMEAIGPEGVPIATGLNAVMERLGEASCLLTDLCAEARRGKGHGTPLQALAAEYRKAHSDFDLSEVAEQELDRWRDAIFAYAPSDMREVAEKSSILLEIWNHSEGMTDGRINQLLQSMGGKPCAS